MFGVKITNIAGINKLGYQIIETEKTEIFFKDQCLARITVTKKGDVRVKIYGPTNKKKIVKWVEISPSFVPKTLMLEMGRKQAPNLWCQLPTKGDLVFW